MSSIEAYTQLYIISCGIIAECLAIYYTDKAFKEDYSTVAKVLLVLSCFGPAGSAGVFVGGIGALVIMFLITMIAIPIGLIKK